MGARIVYEDIKDSDLIYFGVYCIENRLNHKVYVGSTSTTFRERFQYHRKALLDNDHSNKNLQLDFNNFGLNNFKFVIIEKCKSKEIVKDREQIYINKFNERLYNICMDSKTTAGVIQDDKLILDKSMDWIFVSPCGKIEEATNMRKYCRENNLPQSNMIAVANRTLNQYKGWLCYHKEEFSFELLNKDKEKLKKKIRKLMSPQGEIYEFTNISEFGREHSLDPASIHNVLSGRRSALYGWRLPV